MATFWEPATNSGNVDKMCYIRLEIIAKKMEKSKKTHFVHLLLNSYVISLHILTKKTATTAHVGKKKAKNAN